MFRTSTDLTYPSLHVIGNSLVLLYLSRLRSAVPRHSLSHDLVLDLSNVSWFDRNPASSTYQCRSVSKIQHALSSDTLGPDTLAQI